MAKCRFCGSEYYSDSDHCFACGQQVEPRSRNSAESSIKGKLVYTSAVLFSIGVIIACYASVRALSEEQDSPGPLGDVDWAGMSVLGTFIASVGAGLLLYSLMAVGQHLSAVHGGAEPLNRNQAALLALGISALVFEAGYIFEAAVLEFSFAWEVSLVLLSLAVVLVTAAFFWAPRPMFDVDEDREMPRNRRRLRGWSVVALGVLLELVPPMMSDRSNPIIPFFMLLFGFAVIFGGLAILMGPFERPWIPGKRSPRT
ncbi:MAG TPA: hypothetical protein VF374_03145 [Thermoplasmata archaeon]|jgi:hypothetical protein